MSTNTTKEDKGTMPLSNRLRAYLALKTVCRILSVSIILNLIAYAASFFCDFIGILDHLSCALGFISLIFACWGLFIAGSIKKTLASKTILTPIEKLKIKYSASSGDGSIKYLSKDDKTEALQTLQFAIKTGKFLPADVINAMNEAIKYLEGKQEDANNDHRPIYTVFLGYLDIISTASL